MLRRIRWILPLVCLSANLPAADLAPPTVAKFIRLLIAAGGGVAKVNCADKEVAAELRSLGLAIDPEAAVVWAGSDREASKYGKLGKLVICGQLESLATGASVALVAEGGRPAIYISPRNLSGTGITLPDSILKLAKVAK
jgi:hypothetical protein